MIDDEPTLLKAVEIALREQSVEVIGCCTGQEGLKMVDELRPQVILLDLFMPGMTGIQFLDKLQLKPSDPYAIAILSGSTDDENLERSFNRGGHYFLHKPFS